MKTCLQRPLSWETTCLDRPHYGGQWGGLSREVLLVKYSSFFTVSICDLSAVLPFNKLSAGTQASDMHFQAYLLDGLARWNEDRARAAANSKTSQSSYSGLLCHAVNELSSCVLKKKLLPGYSVPRKYTGKFHSWSTCIRWKPQN